MEQIKRFKACPSIEKLIHVLLYMVGVVIMPLGVVMTVLGGLGAGGYDALNFAIGKQLSIPTSLAIYMTAFIAVILTALIRRTIPKISTFVSSFFIGLSTDYWSSMLVFLKPETLGEKIVTTTLGILFISFAVSAYVISLFPTNPTDDLMVALSEKGLHLGKAKLMMDGVCVILAILLHGEIGIGTLIITICLGPCVGWCYGWWKKMPMIRKMEERN